MTNPLHPRAPHWYDFNEYNDEPSAWTFETLDWDDDPEEPTVGDSGTAELTDGNHRFVITTWLVERDRTHDRYWSVAYETIDENGEPEPLALHIGQTQAIARNNFGWARKSIDQSDSNPHVLVRKHPDDTRETFEFPTEWLAAQAADLQTRLTLDDPDRDYIVFVESKAEWEESLARDEWLAEHTGGESDVA